MERIKKPPQAPAALTPCDERPGEDTLSLLKATFNSTNDGIIVVDRRGRIQFVNQKFVEMLAIPQSIASGANSKALGVFVMDMLDDPRFFFHRMKEMRARHEAGSHDVMRFKNGMIFEVSSRPQRIGELSVGRVWSVRDITERERAQQALRESEARYRMLFNSANDALFMHSIDRQGTPGMFLEVNDVVCQMLGYPREELLGMSLPQLIVETRPVNFPSIVRRLLARRHIIFEAALRCRDGKAIPFEISAHAFEHDGKTMALAIARNIAARRETERILEEERRRLYSLFNRFPGFIYLQSPDHVIRFANRYFREHIAHFEGNACHRVFFNSRTHCRGCPVKELFRQQDMREMELTSAAGITYQVYIHPFTDVDGSPLLLAWGIDISARKKEEQEKERLHMQLVYAEKMAGVGTLANGVAHEFNNMLQIMNGYAQFALSSGEASEAKDALKVVVDTSDRAARIVKNLLTFSRPDESGKTCCDIVELIESVLSLVEYQMKKHSIRIIREYRDDPVTLVNRAEIQQVFLNIVNNARDAMVPRGGELTIEVCRKNDLIEVRVTDTGKGIPRENFGKVFEPFYTTKGPLGGSPMPGTGLGLYVSYGIMQRHGGSIEVESQVGKYSTFIIRLPVADVCQTRSPEQQEEFDLDLPDIVFHPLHILVVDDEHEISSVLAGHLAKKGHTVQSVSSADEALAAARQMRFDMIFLDIIMPGKHGTEILAELRDLSPETRIVIMTGKLMEDTLFEQLKKKGAAACIEKPFTMDAVDKLVHASL